MEKQIGRSSYWLGMACLVVAVILRIANAAGLSLSEMFTKGNPISYRTFLVGAVALFVVTIATRSYSESR